MYLFSVSLNVNDAIRKTNAQMIQNSFHTKIMIVTISFKERGRLIRHFQFFRNEAFRHFE